MANGNGSLLDNKGNGTPAESPYSITPVGPPMRNPRLLRRQLVGGNVGNLTLGNVLPQTVDDAERAWGFELYERQIATDPAAHAAVEVLKLSAVGDGLQLSAAVQRDISRPDSEIDPETQADIERAEQIRHECQWQAERLNTDIDDLAYAYLHALEVGCCAGELLWEDTTGPDGKPALAMRDIAILTRRAWRFVCDPYLNVVGIQANIVGGALGGPGDGIPAVPPTAGSPGGLPPDNLSGGVLPAVLPPEKFAWFTWLPDGRDPRGRSIFRAAYNAWLSKSKTLPQRFLFNARFGSPRIVVIEPASPPKVYDETGTLVDFGEDLANQLAEFDAGTYLILPQGSTIEIVEAKGDGAAYETSIDRDNREIVMAILCNTRTILESKHGSRADSGTSKDVTDTVVRFVRRALASFFQDQVFYKFVLANHGREVADRLTPNVSFGSGAQEDWASVANASASLASHYPTTEAQLRALDERLGLPVRAFGADVAKATVQTKIAGQPVTAKAEQAALPGMEDAADNGQGAGAGGKAGPGQPAATGRPRRRRKAPANPQAAADMSTPG